MRLSFSGTRVNAKRELFSFLRIIEGFTSEDDMPSTMAIECAISAYHDVLLALFKGDIDMHEARDFLLHGKSDDEIAAISYCGDVVLFKKEPTHDK